MESLLTPLIERPIDSPARPTHQAGKIAAVETNKAQQSGPPTLIAPQAPTDAQIHAARGHQHGVADYLHELHQMHADWEGHALGASSPIWRGADLVPAHGTTLARLIASMGHNYYLAHHGEAWQALTQLLRGQDSAAQELLEGSPKLRQELGQLVERVSGHRANGAKRAAVEHGSPAPTGGNGAGRPHIHSLREVLASHVAGHDERVVDASIGSHPLLTRSPGVIETVRTSSLAGGAPKPLSVAAQLQIIAKLLRVPQRSAAAAHADQAAYVILKDPQKARRPGARRRAPGKASDKKVQRRGEAYMSARHDDEETTAARRILPRCRRPAAMLATLSSHGA